MNNYLSLLYKQSKRHSALYLVSLWLMFSSPASAIDLQCNIAENAQIKPAVRALMIDAADKGYLYYTDNSTSLITFQVNHFPFSTVNGVFNQFQGGLALPVENEQSEQALFVIKADSVFTGDDEVDDYLKSSVFFNVTQFPEIIFVSTGFEWVDESTARLHGNLTLHGKTRPLVFNMYIDDRENDHVGEGQRMTMVASAEIKRSDFGMHELQIFVSDTVTFNLKIKAFRVRS